MVALGWSHPDGCHVLGHIHLLGLVGPGHARAGEAQAECLQRGLSGRPEVAGQTGAAPTCPQPRCGALTHHPSGFLMSVPCPGLTGGLVSPPPPDCLSLCLGPEKGLTWEVLWLKPRSPPATAAVVASASSSSSKPGALQHPWQGLVSTWRHTGVSGAWSGGQQLRAQRR